MDQIRQITNISSLAELGATVLPDTSIALLDHSQEKILADIISACDIARLSTTDVCDNIYTFLITGDEPFDQSWDGEVKHFGVEDNIWKVTVSESKDRNNVMRLMHITNVSNGFLWGETSLYLEDEFIYANDDDHSSTKISVDCSLLLTQIYNKIMAILATPKTIQEYNNSISDILPDYKLTYYVKRSDLRDKNIFRMPVYIEDPETKVKVKNILKDSAILDNEEADNYDVIYAITPRQYVSAWCIAHKSSSSHLHAAKLEDTNDIGDDEYFRKYNSKGDELIDMLKDGGWDDPSVLEKWGEEQSPYHCYDVVYARTHLQPYGKKLYYANSTHYYIDLFLTSIIPLHESIGDLLYIIDASKYIDILDEKDYVRLVPSYADKYMRNYKLDEGPCYIEQRHDPCLIQDIRDCKSLIKKNEYCPPIVSTREFIIKSILQES